jgi:hypothetical protein
MNLDGFCALSDQSRGDKEAVLFSTSKEADILGLAEAHISRFDVNYVREIAKKNGLVSFFALCPSTAPAAEREACRAHNHMHYPVERESSRPGFVCSSRCSSPSSLR